MADNLVILCRYFLLGFLLLTAVLMIQTQQTCFDNFAVSSPTSTSIRTSWIVQTPPNCQTITMNIFLKVNDSCEVIEQAEPIFTYETKSVTDQEALFDDLSAFSLYYIVVLTSDSTHVLEYIEWTTSEGDITGFPSNITATSFINSLKFSWEEVPCGKRGANITMYEVRLVGVIDDNESLKPTQDRNFSFKGLAPDTEYEFEVRALAVKADGDDERGPYSEPLRIRTLNDATDSEGSTTERGLILIIAVPASLVFLLPIFVVAVFAYCKMKKKSTSINSESFELPVSLDVLPDEDYDCLQNISKGSYEIAWKNLIVSRTLLGQGKFGSVYEGSVKIKKKWVRVAVKSIRNGDFDDDARNFDNELKMMKRIGGHVNIVSLVGACKHKGTLYVALEYVSHGNLRQFLLNSRRPTHQLTERESTYSNSQEPPSPEYTSNLTSSELVGLALGVAKGMLYLSSKEIIHRDLAARNVLVAGDQTSFIAKISDFGLSRGDRIYEQPRDSMSQLPIKWTAPEAFNLPPQFTTKSDVWSFGILLWEIVTIGGKPYSNPKIENATLPEYLEAGHRMDKPQNCDKKLYDLMMACWRQSPKSRPTFDVLVDELEALAQDGSKPYVITRLGGDNISFVPINSNEYEIQEYY